MSSLSISKRITEIPFAGIRRVFEKAARLEASGVKVIHFEIGRPDFDTPPHIKEAAFRALERGMVHYTSNAGLLELRKAIAENIFKFKNVRYNPDSEIMVTAGGQESMYLTLQALLNPGDEVLVPDPGYSLFFSCVKLAGGVPVAVPLQEEKNFSYDIDTTRKLITDRSRAIIVNSPHNPTGTVLTEDQMEAVCSLAVDQGLLVLTDEAYDRILYDNCDLFSPSAIPDMKQQSVIWGSLSKTYSMTGWRIGYLAAPPELIAAAIKVQQNLMLSVCSFAQAGAIAALRGPQACVDAMVDEFNRRRLIILSAIEQSPGLSCPAVPMGSFYVFVKHSVPGMNSTALADYLLDRGGVAVVPGSDFGSKGEGFLRFSYSTSLQDCTEGMERVVRIMTELST